MAELALSAMAALFELTHYPRPTLMANRAKRSYSGGSYLGWRTAMGELLVTLTIPPLVGVITYYIVRRVWERDEERSVEGHEQRSDGSQKVIH